MKIVRFIAPAEDEMLNAAFYYQQQSQGLGTDFLDKIDVAASEIGQNPEIWPLIHHRVQRRLIQRFPYALLYRNDPDEIVILAVMHLHRRPDYWVDRL